MVKKMRAPSSLLLFFVIISFTLMSCLVSVANGDDSLAEQCSDDFQKVGACLDYATEKANTPTKGCCDSVSAIRATKPVCLCYFILQMHNGSSSLKSLGLSEDRLLQLPSACRLANASVSDCPRLLNLPPGSQDTAIFTSNTTATTTPASTSTGASSPERSNGFKSGPELAGTVALAATIIFFTFQAAQLILQ